MAGNHQGMYSQGALHPHQALRDVLVLALAQPSGRKMGVSLPDVQKRKHSMRRGGGSPKKTHKQLNKQEKQ